MHLNNVEIFHFLFFFFFLDISLSPFAHGPAITFTIHRPEQYDISVDVSPTIEFNIETNTWPRTATRRCLEPGLVEQVKKTGTHLVPKDDQFWNISFSTAEKILMLGIDREGECRRMCHKILKFDVHTWEARRKQKFQGISTHTFKVFIYC